MLMPERTSGWKSIATVCACLLLPASGAHAAGLERAPQSLPFAATFTFGGGGFFTSDTLGDYDAASIVAAGDFVLSLNEQWNLQLGGGTRSDFYETTVFGPAEFRFTGTQANAIAFWRDHNAGVFGIEAGLFSEIQFGGNFVKLGGVAQYFVSDMATISAFAGVLLPFDPAFNDTSFYGGGSLTYYASDNFALATEVAYQDIEYDFGDYRSLKAGGSVRFLTPMQGVELAGSGYYRRCGHHDGLADNVADGMEFMGTVRIHLGGAQGSLASLDRSGAIDTRTWTCEVYSTTPF
jgi:hypothetical protein